MDLHKKITLLFAAIAVVVVGFFSWEDIQFHKLRINASRTGRVELLTEIIGNGLRSLMIEGRGRDFQKFLENLIAEDISAIRLFTQEGKILNSTVPGEIGRRVPDKSIPSENLLLKGFSLFNRDDADKRVFSKVVLIKNDRICQRCHGGTEHIRGVLDVEFATSDSDAKMSDAIGSVARSGLIMLFVLVGSVWLLARYLLKSPLDLLAASTRRDAEGALLEKIIAGRQDEIGRLAIQFRELRADIDRKMEEIANCRADRDSRMEKMASIGELAAAVAHEIKNPLAGISGALQVLAEDFPDDSPRKEISQEILQEIERLDKAVKDLLFFAVPPELHQIPVDMHAVIDKVSRLLRPLAATLEVTTTVTADAAVSALIDPEQMEIALMNIAHFSFQSLQKGGHLTIGAYDRQDTGSIEIIMADTGPGLSEEKVAEIFRPFFSTKHSGSGLSLAITSNIINRHNGTISVESRPGTGTAFHILIPKTR